jgi:hypothetical protein
MPRIGPYESGKMATFQLVTLGFQEHASVGSAQTVVLDTIQHEQV